MKALRTNHWEWKGRQNLAGSVSLSILASSWVLAGVSAIAVENECLDSTHVKALKKFTETPPIIKSLTACVETTGISCVFLASDITNLESFSARLKRPAASDALSTFISSQLSRPCRMLLSNYTRGPDLELRQALATDLNGLISYGLILKPDRFAGIALSSETSRLLGQTLYGPDLTRLNRTLLLEAYPKELSNQDHPALHRTYLEIRCQPGAFYVKTATNLDGLADSFVRPIGHAEIFNGGLRSDSLAAGWYGSNVWCIANGVFDVDTLSEELIRVFAASNRNPVIAQMPLFLPSRIMNMAVPSEKLGALKWFSNTTRGIDHLGQPFTAELQINAQGRPTGLNVLYPNYPPAGITQALEVAVSYEYRRDVKGWDLPTVIRIGTNWTAQILSIEYADHPMAAAQFQPNRFINKKSYLALLVRRRDSKEIWHTQYKDLKHGLRRVAGIWFTNGQLRSGGLLLFCALTAAVVAVGAAIERKQNEKQSTTQIK